MASRGFTDSQIEAFTWVMKTRSATEAAEKMLISQPAVSRLIKQLEERLGFSLFERVNNRLLPTRHGSLFYNEVERVYVGLNHLKQFADKIKDTAAGQLRIVSMPSFATSLLPSAAILLAEQFPELEMSLYSYRSEQIPTDMAAERFDFAITLSAEQDARYQSYFYSLPTAFIVPKHHPLAQKSVITPQDLQGETLIVGEPEERSRATIINRLNELDIKPKKIWTVSLSDIATRLVANGKGISVINAVSALDAEQHWGVVCRPFEEPIESQLQLILPLDKNMDPATQKLVMELKQIIERKIYQCGSQLITDN
ncbi:LysR family transcriptional regulator [Photobacterium sanctipauli]|uniref:LysR family transcriptional regulator n=1 Tax=Photobacterium sanctipauli TaxID=1342794 RepID=A0A2T3NWJ4_9GAMM|nr:LysR substrate-binding domain-containing protein [Photobacterium sanctipauli]PSW20568.1 LysR family transcriptional regulator [Photobacterium sanctipauli]